MRLLAALALAFLAITGLAGWTSTSARAPTVTCDRIIYPDAASARAWRPTRVVLGVAAVPPAYIPQTVASGDRSWPHWSKSGLVIRADSSPITLTVPSGWRSRAAITWGNVGPARVVRIASCAPSTALGHWNPYAGGFFLRSRAACVPLTFTVDGRSATVRFGIGKRCR